jgi:hypothetical protein
VGGQATHCGQLIDKYSNGRLYIAEMIGDFRKETNDLRLNSLKQFNGITNRIVEIRRSTAYSSPEARLKFRVRALQQKVHYDFRELLCVAFSQPDKYPNKLICSGWCYQNGVEDGVPWGPYPGAKLHAPTPEELRLDRALYAVDWK